MAVEEHIDVGGPRLWTARQGSGPPLVLVHGGPGLSDYLGPVASMLADRFTVLRYEQRGCGRSTGAGPNTVAAALADLEALRLRFGCERWTVVGHSFGAGLALAYAADRPGRVERLVALASTGITLDWKDVYHAARARRRDPEPEFEYPANLDVNRELNEDWERWIEHPDLGAVTMPALFVHGTLDPRPPGPARRLAESLPGASFVEIPGCGHYMWLTHAAELGAVLDPFLGAAAAPRDSPS